jgi:hypothetical protein
MSLPLACQQCAVADVHAIFPTTLHQYAEDDADPPPTDNSVVHNRPIVSNKEAIAINQAWAGDAGRLANQSVDQTTLPNCGSGTPCKHSRWMVWTKALPAGSVPGGAQSQSRAAVLLMNNGDTTTSVSLPDLSTVRVL